MDNGLRAQGVSVPAIYEGDLEAGVLLIEDLGSEGVVDENGPIPERYAEAVAVLAHLHGRDLPESVPVETGREHVIPPYDLDALLIEAELALDWYMPHIVGTTPSGSARSTFVALWKTALEPLQARRTWTLRDMHSPNILWQPLRQGMARAAIIDFQDAVLGHPAYDLAALLQD
ncbi:phosphotransferase, partial [Nostoc sp. NIES-2111]